MTTSKLSIRVKNSTVTFVKLPSHKLEVEICTSELSIREKNSAVIFVKPPSQPVVVEINTSEVSIRMTIVGLPSNIKQDLNILRYPY